MMDEEVGNERQIGHSALVKQQDLCALRRVAYGIAVVGLLSGCTPANETGVGLSSDGAPTLRNCGAWLRGVVVSDGETGREIWSAEKSSGADEYGVGDLKVGVLPDEDWVEQSALVSDPRPAVWRFDLVFRDWDPRTIDVADHDLRAASIIVPGRSDPVTFDAFRNDVCGEGIGFGLVSGKYVALGLGLVALIAAAAVAALSWSRRRQAQSS